jgi:hypothetical protein
VALTDAQMTDVRRYAGYPLAGTTMTITDDQDVVYMQFGMVTMSLHRRLTSLSTNEETVLGTYLTTLAGLETAVAGAGANLDTDQAAVWKRNRSEVGDRAALFDQWRFRMCAYLGLPPGPGLAGGGNRLMRA